MVIEVRHQILAASVHEVEAMLVEAWHLWRRSPGVGRWPFAGDAPWHLMVRDVIAGDYDARGGDGEAPAPKRAGLTRAEVAIRDEVSAWLALVSARDAPLVCAVIRQMASKGASQPDFMALRSRFRNARTGGMLGSDGLRKRYDRALGAICRRVSSEYSPPKPRIYAVGTLSSGECVGV